MKLRALLFFGFAALIAAPGCQTRQAGGHADSPATASASPTISRVSARDVLAELDMRDVTNAIVMARTSDGEQVVVAGQRGTKYVAAVAYRHPYVPDHPWRLRCI